MAGGSIGSIFVDMQARTAGLDKGVADAKSKIKSLGDVVQPLTGRFAAMGESAEGMLSRVGMRLIVSRLLVSGLAQEFRKVAENADQIQGLSPETLEGVRDFSAGLHEAQNTFERLTALSMSGWGKISMLARQAAYDVSEFYKQAKQGTGIGMFGSGSDDKTHQAALDASSARMAGYMEAQANAWKSTPEYQKQVEDEQQKVNALMREYASLVANATPGQRADAENSAAAAYMRNASAGALGQVAALKEQAEAYQDLIEAKRTDTEISKALAEAEKKAGTAQAKLLGIHVSTKQALEGENSQLMKQMQLLATMPANPTTDKGKEDKTVVLNNIAEITDKVAQLQEKLKEPWTMMQQTAVSALQSVSGQLADMLEGKKTDFRKWAADVVNEILQQFLKLSLINPILNGLFGMTGTKSELPGNGMASGLVGGLGSLISGFLAGGGPASQGSAYVVGEEGPEVFVPGASGTVIPNGALQGGGGGGGNGPTFNQTFNVQSGVSHAEFAAAMPKIINAAKAAMVDAVRRGGPYASAFGQ